MSRVKKTLAFRFDVDSVRCVEEGIPRLMRVADRLGVRFTFFVNMGYSFNWRYNLSHLLRRRGGGVRLGDDGTVKRHSLPTTRKLGLRGTLKTVLLNPRLGDRYRAVFDTLHREGHELGLHGGMDHVIWQRSLETLGRDELEELFAPAFSTFTERYGAPAGFASPGFVYNEEVLALLDRYAFSYASDMPGQEPFRPLGVGGHVWKHYQVPVNVVGSGNVPIVEESLARGMGDDSIVDACLAAVSEKPFALLYGHPYVEGVHSGIIESVIRRLETEYEVLTVHQYLSRWQEA